MIYSRRGKGVLHATEALHDFCSTCNTSTSGCICSEVVSFGFSVEGHTICTQQASCFCFVPGGFIQGFKNCVRIDRLCFIGRAALDCMPGIFEKSFRNIRGYRSIVSLHLTATLLLHATLFLLKSTTIDDGSSFRKSVYTLAK